ncbi:MAG: hypothetical protein MH204_05170, partial [Fimbriimonadaceae bacterium]|nr:hypothetical protein [Fimbriimonadaceae bacterium]
MIPALLFLAQPAAEPMTGPQHISRMLRTYASAQSMEAAVATVVSTAGRRDTISSELAYVRPQRLRFRQVTNRRTAWVTSNGSFVAYSRILPNGDEKVLVEPAVQDMVTFEGSKRVVTMRQIPLTTMFQFAADRMSDARTVYDILLADPDGLQELLSVLVDATVQGEATIGGEKATLVGGR